MVKGKLRILNDGMVLFWCKGCNSYHGVYIDKNKPVYWDFNGDYEKPTFSPSVLVTNPQGLRCHSFVKDGKIQYLSDCSHELAGQTINLISEEDTDSLCYGCNYFNGDEEKCNPPTICVEGNLNDYH